jgi:acyl transferase domain-containing protein/phosphopantetheinyl transferase (holo-ACP synthase)
MSRRVQTAETKSNDIAIVGMSCLFPQAKDLSQFWQNIVRGVDCLRDVGDLEWDKDTYWDPDSTTIQKSYCKKGGFISELAEFDPLQYGVMPKAIEGIDPDQLLALKVACMAFADAGLKRDSFNGERAEVILGRTSAPGAGSMNMIQHGTTVEQTLAVMRALHPEYTKSEIDAIGQALSKSLNLCNSDTIPGVMPNVLAGRIAGRLGFKGRSMVLDSACASSLIAVEIAITDLLAGKCDLAIAGGVHVNSFQIFYEMFASLGALSKKESVRPFDDAADGTLLGEGLGMVVLKRMADAVANGDRIYAVIKGIGSSSDGQGTSMLAPSDEGEAMAIARAYEMADLSPHTVGLLEAHGTGTPTGDLVELTAIQNTFKPTEAHHQWCALGSVKSNIGHAQAASGVAGLIKVALSLYQKVLPPTLNVVTPNKQFDWKNSACYINHRSQVWVHPQVHASVDPLLVPQLQEYSAPRRAAVSAFGFGGVNSHAVLEEYQDKNEASQPSLLHDWFDEVCLFAQQSNSDLAVQLRSVASYIDANAQASLKDVAYTLSKQYAEKLADKTPAQKSNFKKVSIVATTIADLQNKIETALKRIESPGSAETELATDCNSQSSTGIYYQAHEKARAGKLAFVLPGLGAAYPHMLSDLSVHFPDVRAVFDFVDKLATVNGADELPSEKVFPIASRNGRPGTSTVAALASMDSAVVMVLMAEWALYTMLSKLGIKPDSVVGVSTGEFAALSISGASEIITSAPLFYRFSTAVARGVPQESLTDLRTLKVDIAGSVLEEMFADFTPPVYLGAALSRKQSLLSGDKEAITKAQALLKEKKIVSTMLPTAIPYHTPLVDGHIDPDNEELLQLPISLPRIDAWSCSMGAQYPQNIDALRQITTKLFTRPIRLQETIEKLYAKGVTKFIEVGPKGSLTPVIEEILEGQPHLSAAANLSVSPSISQINHLIAALVCHDVDVNTDYLYARRTPVFLNFASLVPKTSKTSVRLDLQYPELKLDEQSTHDLRVMLAHHQQIKTPKSPDADLQHTAPAVESDEIFDHYFRNLNLLQQNMMQMQQHMQQQMFSQMNSAEPEQTYFERTQTPAISPYDLINTGLISASGDENNVQLNLFLTLPEHQYLIDHAIGGIVSTVYGPEKVFLMPLTVALEMMAETAALLSPQKVVLKIDNVRALKRIRVGPQGLKLVLTANRLQGSVDALQASIYMPADDESLDLRDLKDETAAMSCHIHLGTEYAVLTETSARVDMQAVLLEGRAPNIAPENLYQINTMFHGPRMQSVVNLVSVSKKQILARINGRDALHWLENKHGANFITNPLLLDNATQPVLYHLFEHNQQADALLPFLIDSLEIFTDLNNLRGEIYVFAQLVAVSQRGTEANVQLLSDDGLVLAQFNTICSRRIVLDDVWQKLVHNPDAILLSQTEITSTNTITALQIEAIRQHLPQSDYLALASLNQSCLPEDDVTLSWCLDYVLHHSEIRNVERFLKNNQRRREFILGRIAAKEAVRQLIWKSSAINLLPADIIVGSFENGQPFVHGECFNSVGFIPLISIAHKDGSVLAVAQHPSISRGIGIDLETIAAKEQGFETLALTEIEQQELSKINSGNRDLGLASYWAAKEACGKAIGVGLRNNPKSIEIIFADDTLSYAQATVLNSDETMPAISLEVRLFNIDKNVIAFASAQVAPVAAAIR